MLPRALVVLCLLSCGPPRSRLGLEPYPRNTPVAETYELAFYSSFWINLHHVLYAEAWARRTAKHKLAGDFPAPLTAKLGPDEHAAWDAAVAYYDQHFADRDLLFDDDMRKLNDGIAVGPDVNPAPVNDSELARLLDRAAGVYRAHWWPAHDRANRAWIADVAPRIASLAHTVPPWLARAYGTPWFMSPVRVDLVFVANREGAYTSVDPTHITIGATDPDSQRWSGVEIVYHEASHALDKPVCDAFDRAAAAAHKASPQLCHVALFYLTGEIVRQALAARGIDYKPYLYATGLFDRAWPTWRAAFEGAWQPYVDRQATLDDAVQRVVAALPDPT